MNPEVSKLKETTKADVAAWVERWKAVAPILEKERKELIRNSDTAESVEWIHKDMRRVYQNYPTKNESGLEIMQFFFMKHSSYESTRRISL